MQGGRIVADWRGLSSANLLEGRDLKPTLALDALVTRAYRPQTNGKAGSTTTTGTARTAASAGSRLCPDSIRQEITS